MINRVHKLTLLTALFDGTATPKQIQFIRNSQKPLELTLHLGYEDQSALFDSDQPTYHIEVYSDRTAKSYYRYPDGRIEYLNVKP